MTRYLLTVNFTPSNPNPSRYPYRVFCSWISPLLAGPDCRVPNWATGLGTFLILNFIGAPIALEVPSGILALTEIVVSFAPAVTLAMYFPSPDLVNEIPGPGLTFV